MITKSQVKKVLPRAGTTLRLLACPWANCRPLRREVPDVTNIKASVQSELTWASRLGASSPRAVSFPGISVPAAISGTGPCAVVVHAVPRVLGEAAAAAAALPTPPDAVATLLGQTNIHNYMTRAYAAGEGASGPPPEPPKRKPV
jgi:hypothetical protein